MCSCKGKTERKILERRAEIIFPREYLSERSYNPLMKTHLKRQAEDEVPRDALKSESAIKVERKVVLKRSSEGDFF